MAAELSRRGYVATVTLRNTQGIDILASNLDATKSVGIQVKTRQGRGTGWVLNQKVENLDLAANLVFVFVTLNDLGAPEYFIVPRKSVVNYARRRHAEYLRTPKRDGGVHKDNSMRKFDDPERAYQDRWDLLKLG